MRVVGIRTLKNKLSEYVRLAAAGETVLISDRDRAVAQLGPPEAGRSGDVADALLADAVRRGLITPAVLPPGEPPPAPPQHQRRVHHDRQKCADMMLAGR